jgi:hypothetical protein
VAAVVADHPRVLEAWATLGDVGTRCIERYAAYRIGYHRGLDRVRASGWRWLGLRALVGAVEPWLPCGRCAASADGRGHR